ncbi:MAG: HNH endonuclease [Candidatus Kapaibacterium sp.]
MKEIKLTQGKVALVDDEDYEYLNQFKWAARFSKKRYYAHKAKTKESIMMHRFILNPPKNMIVDHIDHNGLNNQRNNLRICNNKQNSYNKQSWGECGYLGVYKRNRNGGYLSRISKDNNSYFLGFFNNKEDAAKAYDIKAKELFCEFANLNFK